MINFQSILSTFNEKGTLLKWLQKLETALEKSVLIDVTATTSAGAAVFSFHFADGTKLETPPVTLPQGEPGTPGTDGRGITTIEAGASYVAGGETITPLTIKFTEGQPVNLSVKAKNGTDGTPGTPGTPGTDGRGITSIYTTGHRTEGDEEITTLEIAYDSGDPSEEIEVHAQNGTDGRGVTAFGSGNPTTDPKHPGYTATPVTAVYSDGSAPASFNVYAKNGTNGITPDLYRHLIRIERQDLSNIYIMSITVDPEPIIEMTQLKNELNEWTDFGSASYPCNNSGGDKVIVAISSDTSDIYIRIADGDEEILSDILNIYDTVTQII